MSLLGHLEDLSLADIVQIVFLSRRTGVLEIVDSTGRFTVLFRHGLIVNASSPTSPDLLRHLESIGAVSGSSVESIRAVWEAGVPVGTALLEAGLANSEGLAEIIRSRVVSVVAPLLESREGEFNFILSESIDPLEMEYEADAIFKEGGIAPQKVFGDGERMRPLRGLEKTLQAGKALVRTSLPAVEPRSSLPAKVPPIPARPVTSPRDDQAEGAEPGDPFELGEETPPQFSELELPDEKEHFLSAAGSRVEDRSSAEQMPDVAPWPAELPVHESESPLIEILPVAPPVHKLTPSRGEIAVIFERDPLVRVAARRAFKRRGIESMQFGSIDHTRVAVASLQDAGKEFVTFLELEAEGHEVISDSLSLLETIKGWDARLPVVVIDSEADLARRQRLMKAGADMYLTRPSAAHMVPSIAEEQLGLFAEELVLFVERAFGSAQKKSGEGGDVPSETGRRYTLLEQLINELSSPDDISQVTRTVLAVAAEFLRRGVLFTVSSREFTVAGAFGMPQAEDEVDQKVRALRISREEPSVLRDAVAKRETHRGKLRREPANERLIATLGVLHPTEVAVLPIYHREQPVAILYGDNAEEHPQPIGDTSGLEMFLSQAALALGTAVLARGE